MYIPNEEIKKPKLEKAMSWIKRWFCCGNKREREVMKIYNEISQLDDKIIWGDI